MVLVCKWLYNVRIPTGVPTGYVNPTTALDG